MLGCQRDQFFLPRDAHYLNCAYMSPLSRRVVDAGVEGVKRKARPDRIVPADFFTEADEVRRLFATLLGVDDPSRVAIFPSASYGLAQTAANVSVEAGQNLVVLHEGFPSNIYCWRRLAGDRGAELRVTAAGVDGPAKGPAWTEAILGAIDEATAVVAVAPVHWMDGTVLRLEAIADRARAVGAALVVDGTQMVGAAPFDFHAIAPDALICAGYKWLMGPYSMALGYFGPAFDGGRPIEESWMGRVGAEDFAGLADYTDDFQPGARRYDVGEIANFALMPMMIAALQQVLEWHPTRIQQYCRMLTGNLLASLRDNGFGVPDDEWNAGHMFGIRLAKGVDPKKVAARLRERNVYVSVRGSAVRVAVHLFNDGRDVDALLGALTAPA